METIEQHSGKPVKNGLARNLKRFKAFFLAIPELLLLGLGIVLIGPLPRGIERWLGRMVGLSFFRFHRRYRRVARQNVDLVFGDRLTDREKTAFIRKCFLHAGQVVVDYFWFSCRVGKRISTYCEFGDESARRWVTESFPGIFCTAHFGNWELGGHFISQHGRHLSSVFKSVGGNAVSKMLRHFRGSSGQHVIERKGAMKGVVRALRANAVVAMLLDQHTELTDGGIYLEFFGLPATFSQSVGVLSYRLKVPILIAAMVYDGERDRYVMRTIREITAETAASMTPESITCAIRDGFEEMICRWPHQWLWMYRRWKRFRLCDDSTRFPSYARLDGYSTMETPCLPGKPAGLR